MPCHHFRVTACCPKPSSTKYFWASASAKFGESLSMKDVIHRMTRTPKVALRRAMKACQSGKMAVSTTKLLKPVLHPLSMSTAPTLILRAV